ncbi:MAG: HDOD domain-containing protein [Verrucomicrobiota bacterium]
MSSTLARKTIRRITDALDSGKTGALGEIVQTVRKLSGQISEVSIPDLSEIIGRDPTITEKVIAAANSFGYNPSGVEISTINQAIITVGFDRIRNLTLSLMMAQGAGKALDNDEQREMAALSVTSGMLAQTIFKESPLSSADPELAFVSSSLRNYGKLLMSTFMVDEYLEAAERAKADTPDEAYHEVFGITPLGLGHTLLKGSNLPETIVKSLEKVPSETLTRSAQTEDEEILVAAEFCVNVCELAFDEEVGPEQFQQELNKIVKKYGESIPVEFDLVVQALEGVDESISQLNQIIGIKDEKSPANLALRARINGNRVPTRHREERQKRKAKRVSVGGAGEAASLDDLLSILAAKAKAGESIDLGELYTPIALLMQEDMGLESCMVFIGEQDRSYDNRFSARFGSGPLFDRIKNRPLVSAENKDLFGICMNRKEDVLIQDASAGKIATVIPDWIHTCGDVSSLIVLPAVTGKEVFSIFIGTKTDKNPIEVDQAALKKLREFRAELGKIMQTLKTHEG